MIISFQPLQENHLDLLYVWLQKPHVKEWWDDHLTDEEIKLKYKKNIGNLIVPPFIVYFDDKPIGFIQYYFANQVGNGWWPDESDGTVGVDLFVGEENCINRGVGTQILQAFLSELFKNHPDIEKVIADPNPKNHRARRCYEKAGFKFVKEIITPDGVACLLAVKRYDIIPVYQNITL